METFITSEFQKGLLFINFEKPDKIILSTYDIDLTLFILEFYEPDISYDIYYWIKTNEPSFLPSNINLHQLNNNHCKFWYIENKKQIRFIITSANITNIMIHNCLQSFCSITCNKSKEFNNNLNYITTFKQFFDIFNITLDYNLFQLLEKKLLFNIPNKINCIEKWFLSQKNLLIDCNNINFSYLPQLSKTFIVRDEIPPNYSSIISYFYKNHNEKNKIVKINFNKLFHYKLYYSDRCVLLSSNNFSYNYKNNFELGILLDGTII